MTGQDAVNVAESFNELLDITGVILTKLDGDYPRRCRPFGKIRYGKPIKFRSERGEKLDMIEPFYPDRMASRILGMGDVLSLIEKAEQSFDQKKAEEMEKKLREASFTLTDYLEQFRQIKNMGNIKDILAMLPGMSSAVKDADIDDRCTQPYRGHHFVYDGQRARASGNTQCFAQEACRGRAPELPSKKLTASSSSTSR